MSSASKGEADVLRIYGNLSLLETAPVLLAAGELHGQECILEHGSVMSLWGRSSDLASLGSAGRSHIATNSETQALRASVDQPDLRFIFTVAECPYRIVARRSAGIGSLRDLRAKRIGTQIHSSAAYFLDCMLRTVHLTPDDVISVPFMAKTAAPLTALPEALRTGEIDAVALWEPQVQRAKLAIGDDAIEFRDPAIYTEKFNLCTRKANLEEPALRKRIVAFVRALIVATQRLKADPETGVSLVARTAGLDADTVRGAWPSLDYPGTLASDLLDVFERQEGWLARIERREPRTRDALAALIDDSVLREARAEAAPITPP
jgi:sulfonate transport system substrate-binding protein